MYNKKNNQTLLRTQVTKSIMYLGVEITTNKNCFNDFKKQ